jgi:hypothetical protein
MYCECGEPIHAVREQRYGVGRPRTLYASDRTGIIEIFGHKHKPMIVPIAPKVDDLDEFFGRIGDVIEKYETRHSITVGCEITLLDHLKGLVDKYVWDGEKMDVVPKK